MTFFIKMPVIILRVVPVGTRRDYRCNSAILKILPVRIAVVSFIGSDCARLKTGCQCLSLRNIVALPRCQNEPERISQTIHGDMNFGTETAPAPSQSLLLLPAVLFHRSGSTGMRPDHSAVREQKFHIRIPGAEGKEPFPYTFAAPPGKASVYGVPKSVLSGKKPPLCAAAHDPKHSFNKQADF